MILLIADSQPCVLRHAISEGKQIITFLHAATPRFSSSFKNTVGDPALEIVVIDCIINDHNGLNHLDEIKKRRPDVPVIYVTASGNSHVVSEALRQGARDVFQRPVDLRQFKDRINALQKLRNSTREHRTSLCRVETRTPACVPATTDAPDTILRAVSYIEDHFPDHRLGIDRLARIAGMSPFHFCRVFKKHLTVTPMRFVALVRVEKAKHLLINNHENMSVSLIATTVGFYDASSLNKHFKKATGLAPTAYMRAHNGSR